MKIIKTPKNIEGKSYAEITNLRNKLTRFLVSAKQKCNNPKNSAYKYYGGSGIKCLLISVDEIIEEIGFPPSWTMHSIDRINNTKHYERGNIRWAIDETQSNNQRKNYRRFYICQQCDQGKKIKKIGYFPKVIPYLRKEYR